MAAITRPGSSEVFVAMRTGQIWRGSTVALEDGEIVLDLSDEVVGVDAERALTDIEFSPDGDWLYVSLTAKDESDVPPPGVELSEADGAAYVVAAYPMDGDAVDEASRVELLRIPEMGQVHSGGEIEFGPDGMLYLSVGDGGEWRTDVAQDRSDWRGNILRVDPSGATPTLGVPPDNPFVDDPDSHPEIWAYGLRNPWGLHFDPDSGDLWIADVGESKWEEIDHVVAPETAAGLNFGWRIREGDEPPFDEELPLPDDYRGPDFVYPHDEGRCAVIGGVVYRGSALPDLEGDYLFIDCCESRLKSVTVTDDGEHVERDLGLDFPDASPASFDVTEDGEVLLNDLSGRIYELVPGPEAAA